ncbi:hypothetical protein KSS87_001013 [Heliosperma pusillum]|nr:hypothetical protein KSS87_001013 [Heliosperma pusillum]
MAKHSSSSPPLKRKREEIELDEEQGFENTGLDPRLIRALIIKGLKNPTPIQRVAIPLILKQALYGPPDVLVSTPFCIQKCLSAGFLQPKAIHDSLSMLILDEANFLLSQGYEDDLRGFIGYVPRRCQCLMMSATSRYDDNVEKLKKLFLHNPYILTLPEEDGGKDEIIPNHVDQFWFRIRAAILNAELPKNSRLHIIEEFNAGLFDYLIAIDDGKTNTKEQETAGKDAEVKKSKKQRKQKLDAEFGVVRGIDFKNVYTVSPNEMEAFEELKSTLAEHRSGEGDLIEPFPLLIKNVAESLRYRAEDQARSVTEAVIVKARAQDIRNEILNSEKLGCTYGVTAEIKLRLTAHFLANNPRDLDLLKHDKVLSKKEAPAYLGGVPEYLLDETTQEASKIMKLNRAALGNEKPDRCPSRKKRFRKNKVPLKAISTEVDLSLNHKLQN